jgi:hypothetical protein
MNKLIPTVTRYEDVKHTHAAGHDVVRQCDAKDIEHFLGKPQLPALYFNRAYVTVEGVRLAYNPRKPWWL